MNCVFYLSVQLFRSYCPDRTNSTQHQQRVDTTGMTDFEIQQLKQNENWQKVLTAYQAEHTTQKTQYPEFDGWLTRQHQIDGVQSEELSSIHGRLIAFGFLKFQLADRARGVLYQLSNYAHQALDQLTAQNAQSELSEQPLTQSA